MSPSFAFFNPASDGDAATVNRRLGPPCARRARIGPGFTMVAVCSAVRGIPRLCNDFANRRRDGPGWLSKIAPRYVGLDLAEILHGLEACVICDPRQDAVAKHVVVPR
jgi:hypothetical protein